MRGLFLIAMLGSACDRSDPAIEMLPASTVKAVEIQVDVSRTGCSFVHQNGATAKELYVPHDTPVRLVVSSRDGDHEVVLGSGGMRLAASTHAYSHALISVRGPQAHLALECPTDVASEFSAIAMPKYVEYITRLAEQAVPTTREAKVALGRALYDRKGCVACHTLDGSPRIGPSWRGIWGTTATLADRTQRVVDAAYVRASIVTPQAFARPGYSGSMPSFEGQLSEVELESITAFIASLATHAN